MNWTGGALLRSRGGKSSLTAAHRRHFAKARENLLSQPQSYDYDFSMFEPGARIQKTSAGHQTLVHDFHDGSQKFQTVLDNYDKLAPIVNRLESMKNRHEAHKRTRMPFEQIRYSDPDCANAQVDPLLYAEQSNHCTSSSSLYEATQGRNKDANRGVEMSEEDQFEVMRHKLLSMDYWCGLKATRPAKMKFMDVSEHAMIGKRRPIRSVVHTRKRSQAHKDLQSETECSVEAEKGSSRLFDISTIKRTAPAHHEEVFEETARPSSVTFPIDGIPGLRLGFSYEVGDDTQDANAIGIDSDLRTPRIQPPVNRKIREEEPPTTTLHSTVMEKETAFIQEEESTTSTPQTASLLRESIAIDEQESIKTVNEKVPFEKESTSPGEEELIWRKFIFEDIWDEDQPFKTDEQDPLAKAAMKKGSSNLTSDALLGHRSDGSSSQRSASPSLETARPIPNASLKPLIRFRKPSRYTGSGPETPLPIILGPRLSSDETSSATKGGWDNRGVKRSRRESRTNWEQQALCEEIED